MAAHFNDFSFCLDNQLQHICLEGFQNLYI